MNLYNLHSNSKGLYGFDVAPYKIPALAYDLAKTHPELQSKLEPAIMKDPACAALYALYILKRPWPEAESIIMKNPGGAFYYAHYVLKRRWKEAEPHIMKDPCPAYFYAHNVLKRRWPEAEPYIMKDPSWWKEYKRVFKV